MNADSPVVLQHVVGLTLGPAVDLSSSLPSPDLDQALCRNSVLPTLTKRRRSYRAEDIPVMSMPPPLTFTSSTPTLPVVQTPVRSLTPNNRSLSFLQTAPGEDVQLHIPQHRGAVSSISIASTALLLHVEPLPLDQLILHDTQAVCGWPNSARSELFAVARRDIAVTRRNLTSLTRYVDMHDAHLAACDGGLDDRIPLMTVETFPRATGGIQSVLDVADRPK